MSRTAHIAVAHAGAGVPCWRSPTLRAASRAPAPRPQATTKPEDTILIIEGYFSALVCTSSQSARSEESAYGTRTVEGASNGGRSAIGLTTSYTGRALDEETGLYYFRNRMYSGKDGRFVSRDPMGYVDGMSLYRAYYAPNGIDPWGMKDEWHHLVSQLGQGADSKTKQLLTDLQININIDSKEFGLVLDDKMHKKLESAGWWREWKLFFETTPTCDISEASINAKLTAMKVDLKYKAILDTGKEALVDYNTWKSLGKLKDIKNSAALKAFSTSAVVLSTLVAAEYFADKGKYTELATSLNAAMAGDDEGVVNVLGLLQGAGLGKMQLDAVMGLIQDAR